MIDIKTGKELGSGNENSAFDNLVRKLKRDEAIFGIGKSRTLSGSTTKGMMYRNLAGRMAAMGGGKEI